MSACAPTPKPMAGPLSACGTEHLRPLLKLRRPTAALRAGLLLALLSGCERGADTPEPAAPSTAPAASAASDGALTLTTTRAWQYFTGQLEQCLLPATALREGVDRLLQAPDAAALALARQHWHTSHNCLQTLAPLLDLARVSSGLFGALRPLRYNLDAWPLQPGYLDYFDVYPHSGLVNDISVSLNAGNLRRQHGLTDAGDVSMGLHAMAYLLWGEQGQRPPADFVATPEPTTAQQTAGLTSADLPNNRRRQLLALQAQLLLDDLHSLRQLIAINQPMHLAYMSLPAESRLQLWQQASAHVLHQPLTDVLEPDSASAAYFGSHGATELALQLGSLEQLLFGGTPALASQWLAPAGETLLRTELSALRDQLGAATPDMAASRARLAQLQQLLESLNVAAPGAGLRHPAN